MSGNNTEPPTPAPNVVLLSAVPTMVVEPATHAPTAHLRTLSLKNRCSPYIFVVSPAGIERRFLDDVRRLIRRDVHVLQEVSPAPGIDEIDYLDIDDAAAGERASGSERRGGGAAKKDRGRVFGRDAEGDARGDVNHSADLPLTQIIEPDHVVRVDRERDVLLARRHIDLVLCRQGPGLAGEDVKSPTSPTSVVVGEIGVSQARSPAVALVVIRCVADAQEVRLVVTAELLVGIDVALDEQRDPALPRGPVKFVLVVKR